MKTNGRVRWSQSKQSDRYVRFHVLLNCLRSKWNNFVCILHWGALYEYIFWISSRTVYDSLEAEAMPQPHRAPTHYKSIRFIYRRNLNYQRHSQYAQRLTYVRAFHSCRHTFRWCDTVWCSQLRSPSEAPPASTSIDQSLEYNSEACTIFWLCSQPNIPHTIPQAERVTAIECGNGVTLCEMWIVLPHFGYSIDKFKSAFHSKISDLFELNIIRKCGTQDTLNPSPKTPKSYNRFNAIGDGNRLQIFRLNCDGAPTLFYLCCGIRHFDIQFEPISDCCWGVAIASLIPQTSMLAALSMRPWFACSCCESFF